MLALQLHEFWLMWLAQALPDQQENGFGWWKKGHHTEI